ncbi:hypothetical protein BAE44_0009117 [Dichanthelium oligosanthes]|uniref:F-box domain-containing protein n=1 Tax=Dichanthelium oligosanthes TaxID=888268 RepID=A0A1E5VXM2_9POAL|nr:hypothetical protein BAE44_0009117 [Dichanthelium oligosanthes]
MGRRRRRRGALPRTFPLDGEDILREILVRLPTEPSSLPRASLVCKQWLCIVSDPAFLRRYRAHHGEPLLLGVFVDNWGYPLFCSIHGYPTPFRESASSCRSTSGSPASGSCSAAATAASSCSTSRRTRPSCGTRQPETDATWPPRRSSTKRAITCSTAPCSAPPPTKARARRLPL